MRNKIGLKSFLTVLFFFISTASWAAEQPILTHGLSALSPSKIAPPLRLQDLDDEFIDISRLKGKAVVVNFWATWCPPCRREMASLERFYQATKNSDVVILAINVGEDFETVFSFLGEIEPSPNFSILFDTDASSLERWEVKGLPTTYVVDDKGNIVYRAVGGREFDHPELIKKVLSLKTPK